MVGRMSPSRAKGPRRRTSAFAAVLVATILIAVPALGSNGLLASFGPTGTGPGRIGPHAAGIAVDADGRVYVADAADDRVEAFTNAGKADGGWGGMPGLRGIAVAPDGTLVVTSAAGVQRFAIDGTLLDVVTKMSGTPAGVGIGSNGAVYVSDPANHRVIIPGHASLEGLEYPTAVAVDANDYVYVVDRGDESVHVFDA